MNYVSPESSMLHAWRHLTHAKPASLDLQSAVPPWPTVSSSLHFHHADSTTPWIRQSLRKSHSISRFWSFSGSKSNAELG